MPYVTPEGLQAPSLEEILDDIETDQRANIDPLLITEAHEELGQVNGIFASHLREAWEVLEIAWNSRNPNAAEGSQLVATCQLTGTEKQGPTPSVFTGSRRVKVDLDDTTVLPAGTQAQVTGSNPPIYFETTEEVTADDGDGEYLVSMRCTETGPIHCNAGTLTTKVGGPSGWNGITNDHDAVLGTLADTDPQLRLRREEELRATGNGTTASIRARLLDMTDDAGVKRILECKVLENDKDVVDPVTGLPPHSLEALVYDGVSPDAGLNNRIAQTIWDAKGGGIQTIGTESGTAIDSEGQEQTVRFTRPTIVQLGAQADITIETAKYVGDAKAKEQLATASLTLQKQGTKVRFSAYIAELESLAGVTSVQTIYLVRLGDPFTTPNVDLSIALRERAVLETANITINTTVEA